MKQRTKQNGGRRARMGDSAVYRVLHRLLAGLFLKLFRVRVSHAERQPENETYLLCCNHISAFDPVLLAAALGRQQTHFMAKKELFRFPGFARLLKALNVYPVDRTGDVGAIKTSIALIESGSSVGMFPQGTRCPGKPPRETGDKLKNGVGLLCDKTHVTVLPVCLKTKNDRVKLFRRVHLIIGEPIRYEQLASDPSADEEKTAAQARYAEYARISSIVYDRICTLYEEDVSGGR